MQIRKITLTILKESQLPALTQLLPAMTLDRLRTARSGQVQSNKTAPNWRNREWNWQSDWFPALRAAAALAAIHSGQRSGRIVLGRFACLGRDARIDFAVKVKTDGQYHNARYRTHCLLTTKTGIITNSRKIGR
jgi:hypothetical protein